MEEWRKLEQYPDYIVSSEGRVARILVGSVPKDDPKTGWELYTSNSVQVSTKKPKHVLTHRLIAEAFLGKCPDGMVVNHKDGNKRNNRVENLEYVTMSENRYHAFHVLGRGAVSGEQHHAVTIPDEMVERMRNLYDQGESIANIARFVQCPYSTAQSICKRLSRV